MSARSTKPLDISFNISSDVRGSNVDIETGDSDFCVADFYEVFKDQLPCLAVVHGGYCSPITEDTYDKDQMLLLKTTSSQKRVLGKMVSSFLSKQTKLISIPVNYKEKFYILKNGKVEKQTTLDVILRENRLPCKVAYADPREVITKDRATSTRGLTIIELTELFDEVYFLGNCVNSGQLALNVIQVPFYLSHLTFKLVKGFKDKSSGLFNEYIEKLLLVSNFLNYNIPCGNMKIAEYDPKAIHSTRKMTLVQPNIYTDYVTLTQRPVSAAYTELDVSKNTSHAAIRSGATPKPFNQKKGSDRPLPPLPKEETPPPYVPNRKPKSEPFTVLAETVGPKIQDFHAFATGHKQKVDTVATGDAGREKILFEPEPDYDTHNNTDKHKLVIGKALPILATSKERPRFEGDPSTNAIVSTNAQRGGRPMNVKKLSIQEVCECLNHLNLHEYRKIFRDNMVNGDILMDLDNDILCTYFGMNRIEALRLVKFAATGIIPT